MSSADVLARHSKDQSPLFRLRGKQQFSAATWLHWDDVPGLLASGGYRVASKANNRREIQAPTGRLAAAHRRIADLLMRIELPDYVFSQRGHSYIGNAAQHLGQQPLIRADIHRFYRSITRAMVFHTFRRHFQCAADVAGRLADICCYRRQHLPTGSPLSGPLAFFAASELFDEIAGLAERNGCTLTVYVDDITLSGAGANGRLLGEIRERMARHGLPSRQNKCHVYPPSACKLVTGVIVAPDGLRLPNARHQKIVAIRRAAEFSCGSEREALLRTLRGCVQEAKQVALANRQTRR